MPRRSQLVLLALALAPWHAHARPSGPDPNVSGARTAAVSEAPQRLEEAPFVGSPPEVVEAMLRLAEVHSGDVVYDLGCGDGRIVIAAIRDHDARRGVCVEIDREVLDYAREDARVAGVEGRIQFVEGDLFEVDLRQATVVTLYLLQSVNLELRPKLLRELRPGTRVVSHRFHMGEWQPEAEVRLAGRSVYLWRIPAYPAAFGLDDP
jgi:SAM-dependent methyltransferase